MKATSSFFKFFVLPVVIFAIAIGTFIYMLWSKPEVPAKPFEEKSWAVNAITVDLVSAAPEITLYGNVEAAETLSMNATVNAFVQDVYVQSGNQVAQGELLIKLDDKDLQITLLQREASVAGIKATIASEINRYQADLNAFKVEQDIQALNLKNQTRQTELVANDLGSASALEQANRLVNQQQLVLINRQKSIADHPNRLDQLQSQLRQAQAQLQLARLDMQRTKLTAPFAGRVTQVNTTPGNRVRSGEILASLYNSQNLEIRSQIPSTYLQDLRSQSQITARLRYDGESYTLLLDRLAADVSNNQGGVDAFFSLPKDLAIETGRNVQLSLRLPQQNNVIMLPAIALYGQHLVYKIEDGRMQPVQVNNLGNMTTEQGKKAVLITSPELKTGDQIITTQLPNAASGLLVYVR